MAGFSKGPWDINFKVNGHLGFSIEPVSDCTSCATVYLDQYDSSIHDQHRDPCNATSVANAHLIAAAPDMYEALERVSQRITTEVTDYNVSVELSQHDISIIKAALAKARGES